MKLVIDIPEEFESHFELDRFDDSLCRLRTDAHCIAGRYEQELCDMLIEAFKNGTQLTEAIGKEHVDGWVFADDNLPPTLKDVLVQLANGDMSVGFYYTDTNIYPTEFSDCNETGWYVGYDACDDVVAWMFLPTPYKGG